MLFSIHTFELKRKIPKDVYWELREFFVDDARVNKYSAYTDPENTSDFIITKFTESNGVTIKLRRNEKGHSILLIVNPRNTHGENNRLEIYDPNLIEASDIILKLYDILTDCYLYKLDEYILRRLDFCVNLELESQEMLDTYMTLISRSRAIFPLEKAFYIANCKRDKHGVYFNNAEYTLYFYDKIHEIKQKAKNNVPESILEKNIIRFEIRLGRNKIRKIEKEIGTLFEITGVIKHISKEYFQDYIPNLLRTGAYYHLDTALDLVEETNYHSKTKEEMKSLLYETCRLQDLGNSMSYIANVYQWHTDKIDSILKKFDDIGVNPLCLPQRCSFTMLQSIPRMMGLDENLEK